MWRVLPCVDVHGKVENLTCVRKFSTHALEAAARDTASCARSRGLDGILLTVTPALSALL